MDVSVATLVENIVFARRCAAQYVHKGFLNPDMETASLQGCVGCNPCEKSSRFDGRRAEFCAFRNAFAGFKMWRQDDVRHEALRKSFWAKRWTQCFAHILLNICIPIKECMFCHCLTLKLFTRSARCNAYKVVVNSAVERISRE